MENDYIGSPCGQLDQIMIHFAKEGMGTHYNPKDRSISYVPLGENARGLPDRRPRYRHRAARAGEIDLPAPPAECDEFAALLGPEFGISCLADVRSEELYDRILDRYRNHPPGPL